MKRREHMFPSLCGTAVHVRVSPVIWVPLETHEGRAGGVRHVLRQSAGSGWFRPSHRLWHTNVLSNSQNSCWSWYVECALHASVLGSAFSCPTFLSCMAVIYFVIIILKFLFFFFLITTLLNPFPI